MKKMSVEDAANFFGVSKEAIHNRVRRGSLQSVIEDGVKLVVVDEKAQTTTPKRQSTPKGVVSDERYYKYLQEQNAKLQERIAVLEGETRSLRDQKEQMLIAEKEKMERIYKEKDEQLKNILQTLSSKFMLNAPLEVESEETFEAEMIEEPQPKSELISLKKYLRSFDLSEKKIEKTLKKFKKKEDERIVKVGKKIYIDPLEYDYKDLIE